MRTQEQNEKVLAVVRVLLAQAARYERAAAHYDGSASCAEADVFGRAATGALARYLECERKRDALARSPLINTNRELNFIGK